MKQGRLAVITPPLERRPNVTIVMMMRLVRATALMLHLTLAISLWAQAPQTTLKVIPEELELSESNEEVRAFVVLENTSDDKLSNLQLSWFTNTNVKVLGELSPLKEIVPRGISSWPVRIVKTGEGAVSGSVHFRVDYSWQKDRAPVAPLIAFAKLNVKSPQSEAVAEVQVKTTLESLNEQRPGQIYLVIKNTANVLIRVQEVLARGPEFIAFAPASWREGMALAPLATGVIALKVKANGAVQPRKHLLLFEIKIAWEKLGRQQTSNLVATHEVNVGVLGESEILTAFSIPSFLVLPGFLMLVTVGLLWKLKVFRAKDEQGDFPLQPGTAEFWLVALTLSGLMVAVYYLMTGRNYLEGYELNDIVKVWLASVFLIGTGSYVVVLSTLNFYKSRHTPSEKDDAITILKKLHRQKLGVSLDRVEVAIGDEEEKKRGLLLETRRQNQATFWVGPPIELTWTRQNNVQFKQAVEKELTPNGSAKKLAQLLEEGMQNKILRVDWRKTDELDRPYQAKAQDVDFLPPPPDIIVVSIP